MVTSSESIIRALYGNASLDRKSQQPRSILYVLRARECYFRRVKPASFEEKKHVTCQGQLALTGTTVHAQTDEMSIQIYMSNGSVLYKALQIYLSVLNVCAIRRQSPYHFH